MYPTPLPGGYPQQLPYPQGAPPYLAPAPGGDAPGAPYLAPAPGGDATGTPYLAPAPGGYATGTPYLAPAPGGYAPGAPYQNQYHSVVSPSYRPPQDAVDAGRGLGLAALCTAFFCPFAGVILGFMARSRSAASGYKNTPASIGLWVGTILSFVWILAAVPLVSELFVSLQASGPGDAAYDPGVSVVHWVPQAEGGIGDVLVVEEPGGSR
ncbi:hypothetical protein ET495_01590 [Xylanimonas allomyrinae]|uniref:DUF4190 domain-containing protein n=1 Tax=Xylanimonas allomyrinae TaxID=2509459 RepID=A0A4P6EI60_9MICO|nr:DUF4190 domain-containing protein [Xylanimonas allomyrinae]QAY62182.1 hypothetical protein ET495_01590 [Xylanimonas allomyrinae]